MLYIVKGSNILLENDHINVSDTSFFREGECFSYSSFSLHSLPYEKSEILNNYPASTVVFIQQRIGSWYEITVNEKTGYALCRHFSFIDQNSCSDSFFGTIITENSNQLQVPTYAYPSFDAPVLEQLFIGTSVDIDFIGEGWYSTNNGYLPFESLQLSMEK